MGGEDSINYEFYIYNIYFDRLQLFVAVRPVQFCRFCQT